MLLDGAKIPYSTAYICPSGSGGGGVFITRPTGIGDDKITDPGDHTVDTSTGSGVGFGFVPELLQSTVSRQYK